MSIKNKFPNIKPSLNLDFANTKQLDPRITFTRASTATYWDGVTQAKAEENLLKYSQDFGNAAWAASAGVTRVANAAPAPDGTITAYQITATASVYHGRHMSQVTGFPPSSATVYTLSVYMKSASGSNQNVSLQFIRQNAGYLNSDVVVTDTWQRYVFTVSVPTGGTSLDVGISNAATADAFDVYVWGIQLEKRSQVTAYTPTTGQPITKYQPVLQTAPSGAPRFDHNPVTGESLGLLIEEQRTNLIRQTEDPTITWSATIAGSSTRVLAGWNIGFNVFEITATSALSGIRQTISSLSSGQIYTLSFYMKSAATVNFILENGTFAYGTPTGATMNGATGVISGVSGFTSATSTPFGDGYLYTFVLAAAGGVLVANLEWRIVNSGGRMFLGRPQFEAGSSPTSYIPTTTAQVTRAADVAVMTGTNFSSWYRQDEGTIYCENSRKYESASIGYAITDGTLTNLIQLLLNPTSTNFSSLGANAAINLVATSAGPQELRSAFAVKPGDTARAMNGAPLLTSALMGAPLTSRLDIGNRLGQYQLNGHIQKFAYYPKRLSNTELQALTA